MSYGPMVGKIGKFNASDKNAINKQVQAEISLRKSPTIAKKTPATFRSQKRAQFTDKNSEIKRRQEQTANTNEWMANVTNMFGADARVEKKGGEINVFTGFQKMEYANDPWGYGNIELKDVDAWVPEGFTKVMNKDGTSRIVGETKKYRSYYKKKDGDKKKRYDSYIGAEAFLDAEGNLTKSVQRKDYTTYKKSTDSYYKKQRGVMTTQEILYGDDNKKLSQQNWGSYKSDEYDRYEIDVDTNKKRKTKEKDEYKTYLTKRIDFQKGVQQAFSRPGTREKVKYDAYSSVYQAEQKEMAEQQAADAARNASTREDMNNAGVSASDGYVNLADGSIYNTHTGSTTTASGAAADKAAREKAAKEQAEREARQRAEAAAAEKAAAERYAAEQAARQAKQEALWAAVPKADLKGQGTYVPSYARTTFDFS